MRYERQRSSSRLASRHLSLFVSLLIGTTSAISCNRAHYRTQADCEVSDVVAGATANPRFQLPGHNIGVDSRSRLYDPTDPDGPPMPPDDPDSHRLMECVDGHRGWRHWNDRGELPDVEISDYRAWLPYDADGKVSVDLVGALELARLHSRDYQSQLETLYLSALDVTAERFLFEAQFFGGNATRWTTLGRIRNGGDSASILATNSEIQMRRAFTTGGTLVVGLANSIVWQFSGADSNVHASLAHFAISQPLLQYAGKARVMERLTRSERSLLANVRQYERFRQSFYLDVTSGSGASSSLQRTGGLFGGSGLSGFTGVGVGGFGGVGAIGVSSSGGISGGGGTGANAASGYLGLLQQQQFLRNQRARIAGLRNTWLQLNAAYDAGRLENRFQVDFAKQAYYSGQSQWLNQTAAYESQLDLYKMRLGLPPDTPLVLKDSFFDQFNLIAPELTLLQDHVASELEALSDGQNQPGDKNAEPADEAVASRMPSRESLIDIASRTRETLDQVAKDTASMEAALPQRRLALQALAHHEELRDAQFDLRALTVESLEERLITLQSDRARIHEDLSATEGLLRKLAEDRDLTQPERHRATKTLLTRISGGLLELSLLQARVRIHSVTLVPIDVSPNNALQVALARRADWMNAKASLVDTWRLIEFNANALKSNLSVNIEGDIATTGNNPLKFRDTNGLLRAGVQFDAPLTRLIERNQYRQSLIDYQQARRSLMAQRDEIQRGLRSRLRQIHLDQFNLELRRLAVDVAITQTDVARLKLMEPEKPNADGKAPNTTASSTVARDLVDALGNLQLTQADLITVWGDYEIQRRLLDFDLGTMQLDERGVWVDPGSITDDSLLAYYYEATSSPFSPPGNQPAASPIELAPSELPPEPAPVE